ncbi:hypothetical protein [Adhaeribacter terreus]|uniref:STAS/SEC14 domain-containing protein n=1 Tax=Adhaeribacter terreus TaxID=529703 RepID=A0ABW0EHL1_9BACT
MILEPDSLLKLSYNTQTHILSITWPDLEGTPLAEIEDSLNKVARNINHFDIRKFLADHRSGFNKLEDPDYKKMLERYHRKLAATNLEKIARLIPDEPAWEYLIKSYTRELEQKLNLPFKIRYFKDKTEALNWLKEY